MCGETCARGLLNLVKYLQADWKSLSGELKDVIARYTSHFLEVLQCTEPSTILHMCLFYILYSFINIWLGSRHAQYRTLNCPIY